MTLSTLRIKVPANFPVNVTGNGGIGVLKSNGQWVIEPDFSQLATIVASAVADPTSKQVWIWDPVTDEYNVLTLAGLGDALFKTTSDTSLSIGTGSKTFTIDSGKDYTVGDWILATSDADTGNFMLGQVTAYSGTSLTIDVTTTGGSGSHADWTVRVSASSGPMGQSAGYSYEWSTDTAASDPGDGAVKANNATFASITTLYISETDNDGNALAAELATWDDSTSTTKGRIKIYDPADPTNFMTFDLTARTDSGTYDTLTVTPVASGGSFTDALDLRVMFIPKGDKGAQGDPGSGTISGATTHGVGIATGASAMTSTAVMTNGQLLVGQTSADPLPKTLSGDATMAATGALTVTKTNGTSFGTAATQNTGTSGATIPLMNGQNAWSGQQTSTLATLTDGASIAWDVSTKQKAKVTLGGNRTMSAVTNAVEGTTYFLWVIQDATGSRTLSWTTTGAGSFDFGTNGTPTLTTTASKADLLCFEAVTIGGTLKLRFCGIQFGFS